jgi:hypothetical protein
MFPYGARIKRSNIKIFTRSKMKSVIRKAESLGLLPLYFLPPPQITELLDNKEKLSNHIEEIQKLSLSEGNNSHDSNKKNASFDEELEFIIGTA